jgi:hypothetical protein
MVEKVEAVKRVERDFASALNRSLFDLFDPFDLFDLIRCPPPPSSIV